MSYNIELPSLLNFIPTKDEILDMQPFYLTDADRQDLKSGLYWAIKYAKWIYLRTRLAEAQNWKCCWCGHDCNDIAGHKRQATVEHVTPKSEGGTNDPDNLAMACASCNNKRGSMEIETFSRKVKSGAIFGRKAANARVRHNKYLRKAEKLASNGWMRWQESTQEWKPIPFEIWINNLKVAPETKETLYKLYGD